MNDLTREIATASEDQSSGISLISKSMDQIDQQTQSNTTSTVHMTEVIFDMNLKVKDLQFEIEKLNLLVVGSG